MRGGRLVPGTHLAKPLPSPGHIASQPRDQRHEDEQQREDRGDEQDELLDRDPEVGERSAGAGERILGDVPEALARRAARPPRASPRPRPLSIIVSPPRAHDAAGFGEPRDASTTAARRVAPQTTTQPAVARPRPLSQARSAELAPDPDHRALRSSLRSLGMCRRGNARENPITRCSASMQARTSDH